MEIKPSLLPVRLLKMPRQVLYFVGIPIFFFLFMIIYRPFGSEDLLCLRYGGFAFNVAIITAIIFLVLVITRLTMWSLRRVIEWRFYVYMLWCIGEILLMALFVSLYITLISGRFYHYMDVVPKAMLYLSGVTVFPYVICFLLLKSSILEHPATGDGGLLHFYDDKHRLKFVVDPTQILYIQAEENYCLICYIDGEKLKRFTLRITMARLEERCAPYKIVRCHRSYCVNMSRVKGMRREADKTNLLELNVDGVDVIPVSDRYSSKVSEML